MFSPEVYLPVPLWEFMRLEVPCRLYSQILMMAVSGVGVVANPGFASPHRPTSEFQRFGRYVDRGPSVAYSPRLLARERQPEGVMLRENVLQAIHRIVCRSHLVGHARNRFVSG